MTEDEVREIIKVVCVNDGEIVDILTKAIISKWEEEWEKAYEEGWKHGQKHLEMAKRGKALYSHGVDGLPITTEED